MKILIISDTHGKTSCIKEILDKVGPIDMLIHAGDVCGDEEYIYDNANCEIHMVAGNNDWSSDLPSFEEFMIKDMKVLLTHGHRYSVHYGTERLQSMAQEEGFDLIIYGHTHTQNLEKHEGYYILNPGSLALPRDSRYGTYVIMEFDQHGKPFFAQNVLQKNRQDEMNFWEKFWR